MAGSIGEVVAWRVVQGLAGGLLVPLVQSTLTEASDRLPGLERRVPLAEFSFGVLIGPALGPAVGGWLADTYNWRLMFLPGVPVGVLSLAVCARWLPADRPGQEAAAHGRLDWPGVALLVVGVASLEVVLVRGQEWDWFDSRAIVALSVMAAASLLAVVARSLLVPEPVVCLRLLADRHFLACVALGATTTAAYVGGLSTITKLLLRGMGYASSNFTALAGPASLILLMLVAVFTASARGAGGRLVPAAGLAVLAFGASWLGTSNLMIAPWQVFWPRTTMVIGTSLVISSVNAAALRGLPVRRHADGAGVFNLFQNLGASVGITLTAVAIERRGQAHLARLTESHLDALNPVVGSWLVRMADSFLPGAAAGDPSTARILALKALDALRQGQARGMATFDALLLCGLVAAASLPLVLLLEGRRSPPATPSGLVPRARA